jgi:nucleoid DNA-binding protein
MTKADLVERVAEEADMTKKDAEQLVEIIFESIVTTLNKYSRQACSLFQTGQRA